MTVMVEGYETVEQAAERLGIDPSQVRRYCRDGKMPGATKMGRMWVVPSGATPQDAGFGRPQSFRAHGQGEG